VLTAFSVRHARPLAALACVATVVLGAAGSGLDADNRIVDSLPAGASASKTLARVDAEFGGAMGVDVVVQWPADVDWRDAAVLDALRRAEAAVAGQVGVARPISLATIAGDLPPRVRRRLDAGDFGDLVAPDAHMALVRARVADLGSRRLEGIYGRIDESLAGLQRELPGWRFRLVGMSVVSARNIRQLVRDLGSSLVVEVLVIGCILAVAFRSPLAGLVSLIPNVFPLAVIATLLVLSGRALDPATVIVFNVCLGLAVDDTVHVLSALARNRRDGISIATAVRRAVAETGNAVVIGGGVLMVGFAAVTASSVPSLAGFGMLACAAVAAATVAELVFLPALLVVTDRRIKDRPGVDALLEEPLRHEHRLGRAAEDHRDDRRVAARAGVEAHVGAELEEQVGPLAEPGEPPRLAADHADRLQGRRRVGGRAGRGEHERGRGVAEVADQPLRPGQIAPLGAECLADRAHPQVALAGVDAEEVADAATLGPHGADRMGLVHVEQRVVPPLDLEERRQVGIVAVHAVHALDRDHHTAVLRPQIAEQAVELAMVVVAEGALSGLREAGPLHDAHVGEFVV